MATKYDLVAAWNAAPPSFAGSFKSAAALHLPYPETMPTVGSGAKSPATGRAAAGGEAALALTSHIASVPGVGPKRAKAFVRLGIRSVGHLVAHLPHRHEQIESEATIGELTPGQVIATRGEVVNTRPIRRGRKRFEAILLDHTGRLELVFFNQPWLTDRIKPGMRLRVQGRLGTYGPSKQLANPKWDVLTGETGSEAAAARLRPVYPASEELTSRVIERAIDAVLDDALPLIDDHLPEQLRREKSMPVLRDAYRAMHRPGALQEVEEARRRLVYDELLLLQLGVQMKRAYVRSALHAPALRSDEQIDKRIRERLPFTLTEAQDHVVADIAADLSQSTPANRLIQGDVGAGKTAIAVYAMLMSVAGKEHQAALMAPTELLAEQHFASIAQMLEGSKVRIDLLTGSMPPAQRKEIQQRIASGDIDIIIGTHSLLTEQVSFASLAVAVIDEQHRFGVHQRAALREKVQDADSSPHVLVMTATPIPRTLALTVFGDLDVSTLRGLLPGRQPVQTRWEPYAQRAAVYAQMRARLDRGEQAFVLVPAVDAAEGGGMRDVGSTIEWLERGPLAGKAIAGMHGRLKRDTRDHIMGRFRAGNIDVIVATTVIEVGVDVPGATMMVIENADRFGLAQLHQIRGRIGRSDKPSECVLLAEPSSEEAAARLQTLVETADGFELAERDLTLRGPGEFFGTRQSRSIPFKLASFPRDAELLLMARRDAAAWVNRSPRLDRPEEALLKRRLLRMHGATLGLIDVS